MPSPLNQQKTGQETLSRSNFTFPLCYDEDTDKTGEKKNRPAAGFGRF